MSGDELEEFPALDKDWTEEHWKKFLDYLIEKGFFSYGQLASAILGQLNPPQVGTGTTMLVKHNYPPRRAWQAVKSWFYEQSGRCVDCGTRLDLQTDHIQAKIEHGQNADRLDNFALRCRRCNVIRRPTHLKGGITHLTSASALMWILLTKRPKTYIEYRILCREYGLTMADIRFQEAWALAVWLNKEGEFYIEGPPSKTPEIPL
jgi:hypothetical protein